MKTNMRRYQFLLKSIAGIFLFLSIFSSVLRPQTLSKSFEFRYITDNIKANGITDFKGEKEIFTTAERVDFLSHYADYGSNFFDDPDLDNKVISDKDLSEISNKLKSQPLPKIRNRKSLKKWKWIGYRDGKRKRERKKLEDWKSRPNVQLHNNSLIFSNKGKIRKSIRPQSWRFTFRYEIKAPSKNTPAYFKLYNEEDKSALTLGFTDSNRIFYITDNDTVKFSSYKTKEWYKFKVEVDLKNQRYNFYVGDKQVAEFVNLQNDGSKKITGFSFKAGKGTQLNRIWGVGYFLTGEAGGPYYPETFIDEDFTLSPCLDNWTQRGYNDTLWKTTQLPHAHGTERNAKENLYLRKKVYIGDFKRAVINAETIDPGGEIYVNGELVFSSNKRYPIEVEIGKYLAKNDTNIIAIKVNDFMSPDKKYWHPPQDPYIGWFAGRVWIDLTSAIHIDDVFVNTIDVSSPAKIQTNVKIGNNDNPFNGYIQVNVYPWYPEEKNEHSASNSFEISLRGWQKKKFCDTVLVENPNLWTAEDPNLYKIEVILKNEDHKPIDDYMVTSGIRTISQEGGEFRVNGKANMLNGAQIFGYRPPIDKIAKWARCAPKDWLIREIAQIKKMNGNLMRIHHHAWAHDPPAVNINDPRLAELGDQLGIMFVWATPSWTRSEAWGVDFEGLPKYIQQVRNHPSIVMWEVSNHPVDGLNNLENCNRYYEKVYNTIYPIDPSRLISPVAEMKTLVYGNDEGTVNYNGKRIEPAPEWTAPKITRSNMLQITGYGAEWSAIRKFPGKYRKEWSKLFSFPDGYQNSFLNSKERAYFNLETEESIGQPNWNLVKGKPWYEMQSYEWNYDKGSIGRKLKVSEWRESQAWQAFSAWESMKKQIILGIDGLCWCPLHGGANMATYKKPLIDYEGHAKLSYYINRMLYQQTVGASANVDIAYGPNDVIKPVIMDLGSQKSVQLIINIYDMENNLIQKKSYDNISIDKGKTVTKLDSFKPQIKKEGYYAVEYSIREN